MAAKPEVLAIIPALCEEEKIGSVVSALLKQELEVLVIDDNSGDNTADEAARAGAMVLRLPVRLGYGGALQAGYLYARERGYDAIVQLDGDGQHDPMFAGDLLGPVLAGEADITMGSRFLGEAGYRVPFARRLGQKFFGGLVGLMLGAKVSDPTTGYQAMTAEVVRFYCTRWFPDDYPDADIRILLHRMRFKVRELPVTMYESEGQSMHAGIVRPLYYIYKMTLAIVIALLAKLPRRDEP